jgi:hypothetical protein
MADDPGRFTVEETAAIRAALHAPGTPLLCPRCAADLVVAFPLGSASMGHYWEVRCSRCASLTVVSDVPRDRRPPPPGRAP